MAEKVVVDTYAIISYFTGDIPKRARDILDGVRKGRVKGVIHYLLVYELAYHWRRGKIPFASEEEFLEFVNYYFEVEELTPKLALKASLIKVKGDELLKKHPELKHRRLSTSDATSIALALEKGLPIVTGGKDISFVAQAFGAEIIW